MNDCHWTLLSNSSPNFHITLLIACNFRRIHWFLPALKVSFLSSVDMAGPSLEDSFLLVYGFSRLLAFASFCGSLMHHSGLTSLWLSCPPTADFLSGPCLLRRIYTCRPTCSSYYMLPTSIDVKGKTAFPSTLSGFLLGQIQQKETTRRKHAVNWKSFVWHWHLHKAVNTWSYRYSFGGFHPALDASWIERVWALCYGPKESYLKFYFSVFQYLEVRAIVSSWYG